MYFCNKLVLTGNTSQLAELDGSEWKAFGGSEVNFENLEISDSIHLQELQSNILAVLDASGNLTFWTSSRFVTGLAYNDPIIHTLRNQTSA